MSFERHVFDPNGEIYTDVNDRRIPLSYSVNPTQMMGRKMKNTMSSIGAVRNCASIEDVRSSAEQMSQNGLEQGQPWCSAANHSSQLRMGPPPSHYPHLQEQLIDPQRGHASHTWSPLETPGVVGERSHLPHRTPLAPSAGQSVHYRDSFDSGRPGQSDSFPGSCQLLPPLPAAKSSPGWFSKLLQAGVERKDNLPRDTNKLIVWDTFLQRWVDRRCVRTQAGSSCPTNALRPPAMGNDAVQHGVNKYSVQAVPVHLRRAYPSWKNSWGRTPPPPLTPQALLSAPQDPSGYLLSQPPCGEMGFPTPEGSLKVELGSEGLSFPQRP